MKTAPDCGAVGKRTATDRRASVGDADRRSATGIDLSRDFCRSLGPFMPLSSCQTATDVSAKRRTKDVRQQRGALAFTSVRCQSPFSFAPDAAAAAAAANFSLSWSRRVRMPRMVMLKLKPAQCETAKEHANPHVFTRAAVCWILLFESLHT